ncbi:MvaI/BcnI family restriction endonuclease [Komagataeibacter sp. SM21]|uniref:MvaI/BcnI family restriction endonuclease n=1 Tax=Komagataeibacter sp. SM21 TaxID=3242899 RepID=UPI00352963AF
MPLRQLTAIERQQMKRLTAESVDITLLQPTWTALDKGYMDATAPVRNYLKENGLHDFELQGRGARENGIKIEALLVSEQEKINAPASLYKPKAKPTKDGDPRIWFSKLHHYANPDDMLAVTEHDGQLVVINLTQVDVAHVLDIQRSGPLWDILQDISTKATSIADELLGKLRIIAAGGYVPSIMDERADTAIGRTLEAALGIAMNARREPDYKGIELKSYRQKPKSRENRKQLFTKVPNWEISKFNSMEEVLDTFGYFRNGRDRLNCTVSAVNVNSQGLTFKIDDKNGILNEVSTTTEHSAFASWYLSELRAALEKKHAETFWVGAKVHHIDGREHFEFMDVIHTRKPIGSQFDILVEQGEITMDHIMKRLDSGRAYERGPSFKIKTGSLDLLFPPSKIYALA